MTLQQLQYVIAIVEHGSISETAKQLYVAQPTLSSAVRTLEEGTVDYIAFSKIAGNSFIGILAAIVGAACYNKFKNTQLPDWLAFFSGKRFVAIATGLISILVSVVLLFVWPVIFDALVAIGNHTNDIIRLR